MFEFLSDRPVLDFLATISERGTSDEERLRSPAELADWIAQAGLAEGRPAVSRAALADAIALREAMYRALCALIDGESPARADRERINAAARHEPPVPRLGEAGEVTRRATLPGVLALLARDCIELFAGPDRDRLRRCDDARCTRLFVDRSRGARRRWCGMRGCGDRAKAAAYRRRQRAG